MFSALLTTTALASTAFAYVFPDADKGAAAVSIGTQASLHVVASSAAGQETAVASRVRTDGVAAPLAPAAPRTRNALSVGDVEDSDVEINPARFRSVQLAGADWTPLSDRREDVAAPSLAVFSAATPAVSPLSANSLLRRETRFPASLLDLVSVKASDEFRQASLDSDSFVSPVGAPNDFTGRDGVRELPRANLELRRIDAQCGSGDRDLGNAREFESWFGGWLSGERRRRLSLQGCGDRVQLHGGRFFSFGKDRISGRCLHERTESAMCPQGFVHDSRYDFYEVLPTTAMETQGRHQLLSGKLVGSLASALPGAKESCYPVASLKCVETDSGYYGTGYLGCQDRTLSGRVCQSWTVQSPHTHRTTDEQYASEGSHRRVMVAADKNYCRNPTGDTNGIWCYTSDASKRFEYCDPKDCDETMYGAKGNGYRGCQSKTLTGRTCQVWDAQHPHAHSHTATAYPSAGLGNHNDCRNPNSEKSMIWCYTTDSNERWEHCEVKEMQKITTCGASKRMGPTQCQCDISYGGELHGIHVTAGYQQYTVVETAYYQFDAYGARGGNYGDFRPGGNGAWSRSKVQVQKGTKLIFVVGQKGYDSAGNSGVGGGGGGGTFVAKAVANGDELITLHEKVSIIAAAGGGAGARPTERGGQGQGGSQEQGDPDTQAAGDHGGSGGGAGYKLDGGGGRSNAKRFLEGASGGGDEITKYGGFGGGGGSNVGPGGGGGYDGGDCCVSSTSPACSGCDCDCKGGYSFGSTATSSNKNKGDGYILIHMVQDCKWTQWSAWSPCTATCNGGTHSRSRSIASDKTWGGISCTGETNASRACNREHCPADCQWSQWSTWSPCTSTCGPGIQIAERAVLHPAAWGGEACYGSHTKVRNCVDTLTCSMRTVTSTTTRTKTSTTTTRIVVNHSMAVYSKEDVYIENTFSPTSYLDVRGTGCQGNDYCVSTAWSKQRSGKSGTWRLELTTGAIGPILNGDYVYIRNQGIGHPYLNVRGKNCQDNEYCVSGKSTLSSDDIAEESSVWRVESVLGDSVIGHQDKIHLQSMYGSKAFLDVRHTTTPGADCNYNAYCVSAARSKNRFNAKDENTTGTWLIVRVNPHTREVTATTSTTTTAKRGAKLMNGDLVSIRNDRTPWPYLDTRGTGCQGNTLCVSATSDSSRKVSSSTTWMLQKKFGTGAISSGDLLHIQSTYGYYLDVAESACQGNKYCVTASSSAVRGGLTGTWMIILKGNSGNIYEGDAVYFKNQHSSGSYLDIKGSNCQQNAYCVSTARYKDDTAGVWQVWMKQNVLPGCAITYGSSLHLENQFSPKSYLDVRGTGCQGDSYCVSAAWSPTRANKSGTWRMSLAANTRAKLWNGDQVYIQNENPGKPYLRVLGTGCQGNRYCVSGSTSLSTDDPAFMWKVISKKGAPVIESGDLVYLQNQFGMPSYLDVRSTVTPSGDCNNNGYCVSAASSEVRNNSVTGHSGLTGTWNITFDHPCSLPATTTTATTNTAYPVEQGPSTTNSITTTTTVTSTLPPGGCPETAAKPWDYRGCQNHTQSGRTCQRWDVQSPHTHVKTPENSEPWWNLTKNYCRSPGLYAHFWCYTTDPEKRWEYCYPKTCDESGSMSRYRGCQVRTTSGRVCQPWDVQSPHTHVATSAKYPTAGLESNYCRAPGGNYSHIWCYTQDPQLRWEWCVPATTTTTTIFHGAPTLPPGYHGSTTTTIEYLGTCFTYTNCPLGYASKWPLPPCQNVQCTLYECCDYIGVRTVTTTTTIPPGPDLPPNDNLYPTSTIPPNLPNLPKLATCTNFSCGAGWERHENPSFIPCKTNPCTQADVDTCCVKHDIENLPNHRQKPP